MDTSLSDPLAGQNEKTPRPTRPLVRIAKYSAIKGISLLVTLAVGLYITILVVNMGGYVDEMRRGNIAEAVGGRLQNGWMKDVPPDERNRIANETIAQMEEAAGLNQPFLVRTFHWFTGSLMLDFGDNGATRQSILAHLPYTVTLVGLTNLAIFITGLLLALMLSHRPRSLLNRLVTLLAPLTFAPGWVYGAILLTLVMVLMIQLPTPGLYGVFASQISPFSIKFMIIPMLSIFLSAFFQSMYTWRAFFQLYAQEDYVELARAQGLAPSKIERSYILRPTLPYVITSFTLMVLTLWQEAIPLEYLFEWPGIGAQFIVAAQYLDIPTVLGIVVIFAYLLVFTVFILDVIYALVDPRVRIDASRLKLTSARSTRNIFQNLFSKKEPLSAFKRPIPSRSFDLPRKRVSPAERRQALRDFLHSLRAGLGALLRYPSAVLGLAGVVFMFGVAIYTLTSVPYQSAVELWRGQSADLYQNFWYRNPVSAPPAWINWFRKDKLPPNLDFDSEAPGYKKDREAVTDDMTAIIMAFPFAYNYDDFPSEINLFFKASYQEKVPLINLAWFTPDNRKIDLGNFTIQARNTYYLSTDPKLIRRLSADYPQKALFLPANGGGDTPLKGQYRLVVTAYVFEPQADVNVETVFYGKVHGLVGTNSSRRDPIFGLLWGTTVCLGLGLFGAVGTSLIAVTLAAIGAWYTGWVDNLIQRVTEVNLIVPKLLVALLVFFLYSKSIWVIMAVIVLLNVFGSTIKNYRAVFLQVKDSPYIEAARVYGASHGQIIWRYMVPRILPTLIPQMITLIPAYVYYESTLALLGVRDPFLPTWGRIIYNAYSSGAMINGHWYLMIIPIVLLAFTGMAFALVGNGVERVLNPAGQDV